MAESQTRVLVVDDERFFREAIFESLTEAGIACEVAASGEEALAAARDPQVGVVVLDVTLADVDGSEVLRALRAGRPGGRRTRRRKKGSSYRRCRTRFASSCARARPTCGTGSATRSTNRSWPGRARACPARLSSR